MIPMKGYNALPCLAPTAEPISSKWEGEQSESKEKAQKAAQRHFVGLSEVTSAPPLASRASAAVTAKT